MHTQRTYLSIPPARSTNRFLLRVLQPALLLKQQTMTTPHHQMLLIRRLQMLWCLRQQQREQQMIPALALQPSPPTVEGAATILGRACVSVPAAPLVAIHPWSKGNGQPVDGDSVVDVVGNCGGRQSQAFDFLSCCWCGTGTYVLFGLGPI
jgi:hypothetical protein